jgi:diacylglycerol O-acyltransferase / trehalose O-mycolyltransferase
MGRLVLALVLLAASIAGCGHGDIADAPVPARAPAVVAQRQVAPRELDLSVRSTALGRAARVRLLTPAGWQPSARRRWPVLYLLHGCCDSYRSWTRSTDVARWPQLRSVLVVMPEGGDVGFYSNWRDGPRWEDFHLRELTSLLAARYHAGPRRAIAGLSMGGLGAVDYAARRPHLFRAAASFSGVLHPLDAPRFWLGLFSNYTGDPRAVWGDPNNDRDIWRAHDPTALVRSLAGVSLFVSAGNGRPGPFEHGEGARDPVEAEVGAETRAFVRRARTLGVPVSADLYGAGVHNWPYWQRELHRALPVLLGAIR